MMCPLNQGPPARTSPVVGGDRAISLLRLTAGPGLLELEAAVDLAVWTAYRLGDKTATIAHCYTRRFFAPADHVLKKDALADPGKVVTLLQHSRHAAVRCEVYMFPF